MNKFSLLKSLWNYKCPRCRQADLFTTPFNISKLLDMHKRCEVCDLNLEPEPGYYFGAMFISYGISAMLFLLIAALLYIVFGLSINSILIWVIFVAMVSYLKILRLSRSVWIHIMTRYEPEWA